MNIAEEKVRLKRKPRSLMDRSFTAASRWLSNRGYSGYVEHRTDHIAYRCGWSNGYQAAIRDASNPHE